MHKEKLGESTGPWCKILVDDQKIICMVKKIPFMNTDDASRGIITGANPLRKQKVEVCKNIVEMCKNILWTGATKMKKISLK